MSNYSDWAASVNRFLAGFGFLFPASHYPGFDSYMTQAHEMGMTAHNCARALSKRHEMRSFQTAALVLPKTGRGGIGTAPCGICTPCRQASPYDCWAPISERGGR